MFESLMASLRLSAPQVDVRQYISDEIGQGVWGPARVDYRSTRGSEGHECQRASQGGLKASKGF